MSNTASTKYEDELAAEVAELTAERDRARATAVALEQRLAALQSHVDRLHSGESVPDDMDSLRAALDPEAGS